LEGHSGTRAIIFTVSLTVPTALPVSVNFATAEGTATAGLDYTALLPGTVNFAPGETSKTVTVNVLGDLEAEAGETFSVSLAGGSNAVIYDAIGVGTILNDDVTIAGKRKATFTDLDGDLVTISVNKGTLKVEDFTLFPAGNGSQLALVDFSGEAEFAGANLTISAKRAPGTAAGLRFVDVGYIDARGVDLGKVVIKGDLGQIDAGNDLDERPGVVSLSANSLGLRGLVTQLPGGSVQSEITGALRSLKIARDLQDAELSVSGDIGPVTIKGSLRGGTIRSDGKIGAIKISGALAGSGNDDAVISARGLLAPASQAKTLAIGSIKIGGSVTHAQILAGYDRSGVGVNADASIAAVKVGHDWTASSLIAGVLADEDELFGTDDDSAVSRATLLVARIASITIKGPASGTTDGTDHFGFVAEEIGPFKANGARIMLQKGPANDLSGHAVGTGDDLVVREV
jgi:hypothetical protein